ncbi:Metallocarboxypeptidase A-like protein [Paramyrothecium foliicola]|nr:Metallocarboxypeptidase A-like protein [Paramyrothecium foliicola]
MDPSPSPYAATPEVQGSPSFWLQAIVYPRIFVYRLCSFDQADDELLAVIKHAGQDRPRIEPLQSSLGQLTDGILPAGSTIKTGSIMPIPLPAVPRLSVSANMKTSGVLALALPALAAAKVSYEGYKVFQIDSHDKYDAVLDSLKGLKTVELSCTDDHNHIDLAVAPEDLEAFEALGLDTTATIEDLGVELALEETKPYAATVKRDGVASDLPDMSFFESYHPLDEHFQFLEDIAAAFPDNSEVFTAGYSLENRPIQGIHLWGRDGPGKEAIIWHGTVHAREWISAPTVEYMLYKIVDGYKKRACSSVRTLDNYDFYIMPVVNPDGFVYTHTTDRLWRKNRQARSFDACVGTDVNRNWPYKWDVPGGSSTNPCSQTYRGEAPADTPEMVVLTNHTLGISETTGIKFFVDWHAFSQLIMLPYGWSCNATAANNDYQMKLAAGVHDAIEAVNGLDFVYGPTCPTIYQTSGVSMDWAYDVAKAELAWGFELRPATQGQGGFVIPPSNIIPSGEEQWAGMKWLFANF